MTTWLPNFARARLGWLLLWLFVLPCAVQWLAVRARATLAAPEVSKVEPPNWWAGHSLNP
ncbi:MAG: hypothetical protein HYR56_25500, partial [Acidobacteria bacterium]|nr:hypothetical protein [Acidobacteriota bacterium]